MQAQLRYKGSNFLRQRLCLATLTGRPVVVTDIHVQDEDPGLKEHEACFIRLLDKLCDGSEIEIDATGTNLRYRPGQIIGGAGLVHNCPASRGLTYFLEGLILLAPFAKQPVSIRLRGVTNGGTDSTCDTFRTATLPLLARFGLKDDILFKVVKRGAPPSGGGEVIFKCPTIKKIEQVEFLDEGKVKCVRGVAYTTRVSPIFAAQMIDAARGILNDFLPDVWIYTDHMKGVASGESPGYGLSLVAQTITRCLKSSDACASFTDSVGTRHTSEVDEEEQALPLWSPEAVGKAAALRLLREIDLDGVVDTAHQSIVLFFLSLSDEATPARVRLSKLTPAAVQMLRHIRDFMGVRFQIREDPSGNGTLVLSCLGAGLENFARSTF